MDNTSLAKVCNTFFNRDLSCDYSCGLLEVEDKNSRYNYVPNKSEEIETCSRSKISKREKRNFTLSGFSISFRYLHFISKLILCLCNVELIC